jgi:hypothetical protein
VREAAASEAYFYVGLGQHKDRVAEEIRALPLPGDKPGDENR